MTGNGGLKNYLWPEPNDPGFAGEDWARFNRQQDKAYCLKLRAAIIAGREHQESASAIVRLRKQSR